jgi:hypothetical protein
VTVFDLVDLGSSHIRSSQRVVTRRWMPHLPFSERDIERLLEGDVPPGRGDLAEVARWFARVRAEVADQPVPPMNARLLAQLNEGELKDHLRSELDRAAERRRVQQGRRRWRTFAAAAAIVVLGGVAFAALQGPMGEDIRTRPGDDPVSVAESDEATTSTVPGGDPGDGVDTGTGSGSAPIFGPDEDPTGDLGVGSGESTGGVVTTEVTQPPDDGPTTMATDDGGRGDPGPVDWGAVSDECGHDFECWIDAAEQPCQHAGPECWAAAAEACDGDYGCRAMLAQMCGYTDECWDAVTDDRDRRGGGR